MPVATQTQYQQMLTAAYAGKYAYPAINVSSTVMVNGVLKGFASKNSDGIISISRNSGQFVSGASANKPWLGAACIADHVHRVADEYNVLVALHTDHCAPSELEGFVIPLVEESEHRLRNGMSPLFNSHMLDASTLSLDENLAHSERLFQRLVKSGLVLELEIGMVGGQETVAAGVAGSSKYYTTPADMVEVFRRFQRIDGLYLLAAAFGNMHGSYRPGEVHLRPEILAEGQKAVRATFGDDARLLLVFHGGSSSDKSKITETLDYGVVKMNIDTNTQYAFTSGAAMCLFETFGNVRKIDEKHKKKYDPRTYLKAAAEAVAVRVGDACDDLRSTGKSLLVVSEARTTVS